MISLYFDFAAAVVRAASVFLLHECILNVGRKSVYDLIHRKEFPVIRISSAGYRIPEDTFHEFGVS